MIRLRYSNLGEPGAWIVGGEARYRGGGCAAEKVPQGDPGRDWKSHIKFEVDVYPRGDRAVVAVPGGVYGGLTYIAPRVSVLR